MNNGECIISGMAKGVDAYVHTACMEAGGYTIAVLACGLDICYPSEHRLLMERISEKGCYYRNMRRECHQYNIIFREEIELSVHGQTD